MKNTLYILYRKTLPTLTAGLAAVILLGTSADVGHAQALPPGVQDVVKLTQAGIADDVILSQIRNNQATYSLTADQIINLLSPIIVSHSRGAPHRGALHVSPDLPPAGLTTFLRAIRP